jgi:hypothetical protein
MIRNRRLKFAVLALLSLVMSAALKVAFASNESGAAENPGEGYPSSISELGNLLNNSWGWHKDAFWNETEKLFQGENRADDWAPIMESRIDRVASTIHDVKFHGECRSSLCRYYGDYEPGLLRPDIPLREFRSDIVGGDDSQTAVVLCVNRQVGPQTIAFYIFRADLQAKYIEPMRHLFGMAATSK